MDSGNSGSMQSSSGGDEEYDSRSESISAFFNSTTTASLPNLPPPPPTSQHHHPPAFYDTLSYLDSNPNPLLNLDMPWARSLRPSSSPNPSFNDIASLIATSSYSPPAATAPLDRPYSGGISINPSPVQQPAPSPTQPPPTAAAAPRSSKKRSRASRRSQTTVLTTDTSNFRAMVQEFTGIPASPFASSSSSSTSHFPRPRFDLFHPAASTFRSSPLSDAPPPYILRPFAQKVHAPPFGSTSSAAATTTNPAAGRSNSNANASIPITTSTCSTNNPTSITNYQLSSSDLGQHHRPPLNIQSQILNFQSLLQSPLNSKYTMPAFAAATRSEAPLNLSEASYSAGGELGLPILMTSEGMHSRGRGGDEHPQLSAWAGGSVLADDAAGNQPQLMPAAGNSSSCKLNYSAPAPPDFHEKGPESATARGEGMMDSWICTSD